MIWFGKSFIKFCKSFINLIKLVSTRTCSSARVRVQGHRLRLVAGGLPRNANGGGRLGGGLVRPHHDQPLLQRLGQCHHLRHSAVPPGTHPDGLQEPAHRPDQVVLCRRVEHHRTHHQHLPAQLGKLHHTNDPNHYLLDFQDASSMGRPIFCKLVHPSLHATNWFERDMLIRRPARWSAPARTGRRSTPSAGITTCPSRSC